MSPRLIGSGNYSGSIESDASFEAMDPHGNSESTVAEFKNQRNLVETRLYTDSYTLTEAYLDEAIQANFTHVQGRAMLSVSASLNDGL